MFKDTRVTQYYNLARPGATVSWDILRPGKEEWGTFEDQLVDFNEFFGSSSSSSSDAMTDAGTEAHTETTPWDPASTLFLLFFGINDISQLDRMDEGLVPIQSTCYAFAQGLFNLSSTLYDTHSARHFVFLNAHPFFRSPKYNLPHGLGHDIQSRVVESVLWFNEAFGIEIEKFRTKHPLANVYEFDLYRFINLVLDYPEVFGVTDTKRYLMEWEEQDEEEETEFGQLGFA